MVVHLLSPNTTCKLKNLMAIQTTSTSSTVVPGFRTQKLFLATKQNQAWKTRFLIAVRINLVSVVKLYLKLTIIVLLFWHQWKINLYPRAHLLFRNRLGSKSIMPISRASTNLWKIKFTMKNNISSNFQLMIQNLSATQPMLRILIQHMIQIRTSYFSF